MYIIHCIKSDKLFTKLTNVSVSVSLFLLSLNNTWCRYQLECISLEISLSEQMQSSTHDKYN